MRRVAAAITIPVTNAVKQENNRRSFRTTLMAASPCAPWVWQRTPAPWRKSDVVELWNARVGALACADLADRVEKYLSFRSARRPAVGLRYAMSDRKGRFIAICMFIGAVTMIGLAPLQMRVVHSPVVAVVAR